jgi:hypothetical protein
VAGTFKFTGHQTLGYFAYADTETQKMLVAEPGGTYGIRAVEHGLPVPPADGRWVSGDPPDTPPPPAAPASVTFSLPAKNDDAPKAGE